MSRKRVVKRDGVSWADDRHCFIIQWKDFDGMRKRRNIKTASREAAERALAAEKARVVEARTLGRRCRVRIVSRVSPPSF